MKGMLLLIFALVIDAFQLFMSLGLSGVTSALSGLVALIPVVGTAAAGASSAVGTLLGYILTVSVALSFGTMLVTLLMYSGMFYPGQVLFVYLAEIAPLVGVGPGWSVLVWRAMRRKKQEDALLATEAAPQETGSRQVPRQVDGITARGSNENVPYAQAA